ncbi:MAG: PEP-CTERM sorting domain-containing protein [Comamonadaceae bacterium]|nr:PEP-CTERM sorting domain-containing protein [Comamonadaceae bacterium]
MGDTQWSNKTDLDESGHLRGRHHRGAEPALHRRRRSLRGPGRRPRRPRELDEPEDRQRRADAAVPRRGGTAAVRRRHRLLPGCAATTRPRPRRRPNCARCFRRPAARATGCAGRRPRRRGREPGAARAQLRGRRRQRPHRAARPVHAARRQRQHERQRARPGRLGRRCARRPRRRPARVRLRAQEPDRPEPRRLPVRLERDDQRVGAQPLHRQPAGQPRRLRHRRSRSHAPPLGGAQPRRHGRGTAADLLVQQLQVLHPQAHAERHHRPRERRRAGAVHDRLLPVHRRRPLRQRRVLVGQPRRRLRRHRPGLPAGELRVPPARALRLQHQRPALRRRQRRVLHGGPGQPRHDARGDPGRHQRRPQRRLRLQRPRGDQDGADRLEARAVGRRQRGADALGHSRQPEPVRRRADRRAARRGRTDFRRRLRPVAELRPGAGAADGAAQRQLLPAGAHRVGQLDQRRRPERRRRHPALRLRPVEARLRPRCATASTRCRAPSGPSSTATASSSPSDPPDAPSHDHPEPARRRGRRRPLPARAAALAAPAVIDFESLAHADDAVAEAGWVYEEDGWRLTNAGAFPFATLGTAADGFAGSTALINDNDDGLTTLARIDGGTFSLLAIGLAEMFAPTDLDVSVLFTGQRADGDRVSQRFTLDGLAGAERFAFGAGFGELLSVSWTNAAAYHQFDDIVVAAVPEPGSAALGALGLAALGLARRRRAG